MKKSDQQIVIDWLRGILLEKGMTQAELTRQLATERGWREDRSTVNKVLNSKRILKWPEIVDISKVTGAPPPKDLSELVFAHHAERSDESQILDLPNATIMGSVPDHIHKIPVYGQAVGGDDGEFEMNGNVLYEVPAPPIIANIKGAYAVCVSGSSMSPRYEDGEICFVDPTRRVKSGDYVVAQIQLYEGGPLLAFIKRFLRHTTSGGLVLEQFNPPKEIQFAHENVASVHFVAMSGVM